MKRGISNLLLKPTDSIGPFFAVYMRHKDAKYAKGTVRPVFFVSGLPRLGLTKVFYDVTVGKVGSAERSVGDSCGLMDMRLKGRLIPETQVILGIKLE